MIMSLICGKVLARTVALAAMLLVPAVTFGQLKIMPIGDSITAGYTDNPNWTDGFNYGYRSGLYDRLKATGLDFKFVGGSPELVPTTLGGRPVGAVDGSVVPFPSRNLFALGQSGHRGYGGKAVGFLNSNMFGPSGWLATDNPDVILLHIGTNGRDVNGLNTFLTNTFSQRPDVKVIVAQIIPKSNNTAAAAAEWVAYNATIRDTVVPAFQAQGRSISTTNFYDDFLTNPANPASYNTNLFATGNHPNAAGYDVMAERWFNAVQAVVPEPSGLSILAVGGVAMLRRRRSRVVC